MRKKKSLTLVDCLIFKRPGEKTKIVQFEANQSCLLQGKISVKSSNPYDEQRVSQQKHERSSNRDNLEAIAKCAVMREVRQQKEIKQVQR